MNYLSDRWKVLSVGIVLVSVILFNSWFLYYSFEQSQRQNDLVTRASDVYGLLDQALLSLVNMETSQRGYVLSKNEKLLSSFKIGEGELNETIAKLDQLIKEDSSQDERLQKVRAIISERMKLLNDLLLDEETEAKSFEKRRRLLAQGTALMESVRTQMKEMKDVQRGIVDVNHQRSQQSELIFQMTLLFTLLFTVVVIITALWMFSKHNRFLTNDAREREKLGRVRDTVARAASAMAGDLSINEYEEVVKKFLVDNLNVLNSKIFRYQAGRLQDLSMSDSINWGKLEKSKIIDNNLLNQAIKRDGLWLVKDIPQEFWHIETSLGSARPTLLAFLPLSFQGKKVGLIEMGLFTELDEVQEEALEKSGEMFAVGLNSVISREELQALLERTQHQAEELETQQEELKANNEELEQQTRALEAQQETLNAKNSQLEDIQVDLEEKAQELAASSKYKSEFLAKMSHELRTPLNGLLILSSLLVENKDKNLTSQQLEFAGSIKNAGEDLLLLINDILDLSKIEARKMELKPSEFSLKNLISSMKSTFENQAKVKGVEFKVHMTEASQIIDLYTDRLRLEQILRNFISNAIKFTAEGFVEVCTDLNEDNNIIISVKDSGIGIPKAKQNKIFEAFEQADSSVDRKFGGTGLGLSIARELASLLQGSITVVSEEGEGSCFTLVIPQTLEGVKEYEQSLSDTKLNLTILGNTTIDVNESDFTDKVDEILSGIQNSKRSLMIVEDDAPFLESVKNLAKEYDFQPIAISNGELAWAVLNQFTPDAILLDIKLPGISGMGLLEKIKSSNELRHIPVHMISAMNYQSNALRMGAHGYLTKPVTLEKVRSALERIESMLLDSVKNILIIEDDEKQSFAITKLVEGKDVKTTVAKTGDEALQKIKEHPYDCIVLDLKLPDTSGFEFLDRLNNLEISLPPIVIYTGKELTREEEVHLYKYSESIIIKGARSPERLLDEVNLFLHRIESMMPQEKRQLLSHLRGQDEGFKGKTVLLVDDDLRNLFALTNALETKDLNVLTAKDGMECLEILKENPTIDLVLMDIMMPKMNGYEAMEKIRQSKDFRIKNLPIVALTAKAMREDHEKCIDAGANDYMTKPVNLDHLNTILKVWLPNTGNFL